MARRKKPVKALPARKKGALTPLPAQLVEELRALIRQTRANLAQAVNSTLVLTYWEVGRRIRSEVLKEKRATYGDEICATLSHQLAGEFGVGFAEKNLRRMVQFAVVFPERQIVVTLSRQLSWSHFVAIIPLEDCLKRGFYAEMCRVERWTVRTLRDKIQGMLFERTALSRKPAELARQEEAPLGLILCSDKGDEKVELIQLDRSGIRVASYLTDLPPRPLLEQKLHEAVRHAPARLETRSGTQMEESEAR